jgi:ubiquinone/menaquinone biosynthesis C-methylase UbiE
MTPEQRENALYASGKRCQIEAEERFMLDWAERSLRHGSRVLDVGCGSGEISLELQKSGLRVTGVDFSATAVELARKQGVDAHEANLDEVIPFEDATFDAAWAGDVIEHVFDPKLALRELRRVLKPGGEMFVNIPHDLSLSNRVRTLMGQSYQEPQYRKFGQYKHHTFFSKRLATYLFEEAGFEIKGIAYKWKVPMTKRYFISMNEAVRLLAHSMMFRMTAVG